MLFTEIPWELYQTHKYILWVKWLLFKQVVHIIITGLIELSFVDGNERADLCSLFKEKCGLGTTG